MGHSLFAAFFSFLALLPPAVHSLSFATSETKPEPPAVIHIMFAGDMMFDRTVRTAARAWGDDYLFSCLDPILGSADLVVANLEGPITDFPSISEGSLPGDDKNFTFTFPTSTATLLFRHGVHIVNLGNNHILNFGWDGVRSTAAYLKASGVTYFGDPISQTVATTSINGVRLAFIAYNEFAPRGFGSEATTSAQIHAARMHGFLPIVYTHWGDEYVPATTDEKRLAHQFIEAGAEMVIGSHPHVVQEHELYNGKYIYYSLGNLIFDQYWDDSVRHGLMLDVRFDVIGALSVKELTVKLGHDRRTCPIAVF